MCLICKGEVIKSPAQVSLIDDDIGIVFELSLFAINIEKEVCVVLKSFLFVLKKYEKEKYHNMLCLMLDPIFKNLCLISSFIDYEKGVNIVEKYDRHPYPLIM